jgi:flagellar hook-basal body complex protein FliE
MSIAPVGGFTPLTPPAATATVSPPAPAAASPTSASSGNSFAQAVSQGLNSVAQLQATSDTLAQQAATGDLTDVHDYMIAATKASLATELTVAIRNKAVDAFNEIMRMPM